MSTYWSDIWKGMGGIEFKKEPFYWRFYQKLLNGANGSKGFDFRGKKVIEFGCGTGINSILMAKMGADVTFFDKSKEALKLTKKTLDRFGAKGRLVHGDIFDYDFQEKYDMCTSEGLVEHFKGPPRQRILDIHSNVLKRGGRAVIIVPNHKCPPYLLGKYLAEKTGTWIYGKEYPYLKSELVARMRKAGLRIEKVSGGELLFSVGWLFSPLWLGSSALRKRATKAGGRNKWVRLNYDNCLANRMGRVIGVVGRKR